MGKKFGKTGTIEYNSELHSTAMVYAKKREAANRGLRNRNKQYDRPGKNLHYDFLGVLGELIIHDFLREHEIDFTFAPLFDKRPVGTADIFFGDVKKVDVKTLDFHTQSLNVNKLSHHKGKEVLTYWFVKPLKKDDDWTYKAKYWIVPSDAVKIWEVKARDWDKESSHYYSKNILEYQIELQNEK